MKKIAWAALISFSCCRLWAATLHVDLNNATPVAPYDSWATAATNIQTAVNAAAAGDTIRIADGHYLLASEISVTKAVTIRSENGPESTIVDGQGTVRCFSLGYSACVIEGLTITNGYTSSSGGGVYCSGTTPVVTNCIITGNSASRYGGGMNYGTANNCAFSGNSANYSGGGLYYGTANNCTIIGNSARDNGGGMIWGTANNCTISGNSATYGGGMAYSTANNCTISRNSTSIRGGGMYQGTAKNCIVWYNEATSDHDLLFTPARFTCSPGVTHGVDGNITNAPMLLSEVRIATTSPCRGAGSVTYASRTDIDGEAWGHPPSMGCDEPREGASGPLDVGIECTETEVIFSTPISFASQIGGAASKLVWDFGDGTTVTNTPWITYTWSSPGTYAVVLTVYNDTWLDGVSATQTIAQLTWDDASIHVSPNGDDANDGSSWALAKKTIQAGIDAQTYTGGWVWVSNGTYAVTNEILVNKKVIVRSVNGPETTIVDGLGSGHCFNLGNAACIIEGLTITNGYTTDNGGGIYCFGNTPVVTNCIISGNSAYAGGGMYHGTANNCIISGNSASYGGGMCYSMANNCTISGNSAAESGGGMRDGGANNCTFIGNSALSVGGGMSYGWANNCAISGNSASSGGGICDVTANNCTISGNLANGHGGGMSYGWANNCAISGNSAPSGGGMYDGTANNCTITGNSATNNGGGISSGTANNCIVWYNEAPSGNDLYTMRATLFTCSPDVAHGVDGNITNAPMLLSVSHIATNSPCRGAGSASSASGTDIDGETWGNPPSMGCDERGANTAGPLSVGIDCSAMNVFINTPIYFVDQIEGALSLMVWDLGDGTTATNNPWITHTWSNPGIYAVVLTAYNDTWPDGVSATQTIHIAEGPEDVAVYVSLDGNDANDGASWETAKATIQAGVDAQLYTGGWVLVGDGTHALSSEIAVNKEIIVRSLNGPESTIVDGQGSVRCFNLGDAPCIIEGLTITNGYTSDHGGGIQCSGNTPVVTNCTISGNSATYGGGMYQGTANNCTISGNTANYGGGMFSGTANNCTTSGNSASSGGGIYRCTANNCTISGNSAEAGGGMYDGTANNCTISGNSAEAGGGMFEGTANNCIVWSNVSPNGNDLYSTIARVTCSPGVAHGVDGNITNAPLLLSTSHIAPNSPCRGAGSAAYASGTDIDGEAWVNPPSMGCDEPEHTTGPLYVGIECSHTDVFINTPLTLAGPVEGAVSRLVWDFGDGTSVTNTPFVTHAWNSLGTYAVVLTAYNETWPDGVSATQSIAILAWEEAAIHVAPTGDDANDGSSWALAKATIQAGIDAQTYVGGWVLVSNGTYAVSNEILVNKAVWIRSVNGPASTIVDGQGSVRGFNLGNSVCIIEGLTITNGYITAEGGGIYCSGATPVVTNCTISGNSASSGGGMHYGTANHCTLSGNSASQYGGGMRNGTANNCIISGNSANYGGGMNSGTANNCTISGNSAISGGGMHYGTANNCSISENSASSGGGMRYGTANNCTFSGNSASNGGGGMSDGTANNCTISGNSANGNGGGMNSGTANNCTINGNLASNWGGGMYSGTANNCTITGNSTSNRGGGMYKCTANSCTISGNSAADHGGGMYQGTANNCTISGNSANSKGGGMYFGIARNCTIAGNSASIDGGGMSSGKANNCIIWFNEAPTGSEFLSTTVSFTCSPGVTHGVDGNITKAPGFVDAVNGDYRLMSNSSCINWGNNAYVSTLDLDGQPRIVGDYVDMGAYEYQGAMVPDQDEDGIPDDWERTVFGFNVDSAGNPDGDGFSNGDEYIAGTDPTDPDSVFAVSVPTNMVPETGFVVEWPAVEGREYAVLWRTSLTNANEVLQDNIAYPQSSYTDTVHDAESAGFYQVEVRMQ